MIAIFLHPLGWGAQRVIKLCGHDAEAFYPAECQIGKFVFECFSFSFNDPLLSLNFLHDAFLFK